MTINRRMLLVASILLGSIGPSDANAASISAMVCDQNFSQCNANSTGELVSLGTSGGGTVNSTTYSWEYGAAARVSQVGSTVPELGVSAVVSEFRDGYLSGLNPTYNKRVFAFATVSDELNLLNVVNGTLRFTYTIAGTTGFSLQDGFASLRLRSPQFGTNLLWSGSSHPEDNSPFLTTITVTAPFASNKLAYTMTLEAAVYCSYFNGALCTGTGFVDVLHTATLSGVQAYDALGQLVANPGITSQGGYAYNVLASDVPEPSSCLLVLGAIAGVFALKKHHR